MTSNKTNPTLQVMEIERFAIHDGSGIRTVVFLQGCPLRCPWCSNPESQQIGHQLMYTKSKCVACGACAKACPDGAVSFSPETGPVFNRARCAGCESCVQACPTGALHFSGEEMTVEAILNVVMRDADYYRNSGGGLTVSGGEPFTQFEGFLALIKGAKERGLDVAVETTGQTSLENLKAAEPYIDTFLFDFKHADEKRLAEVTKANAGLIFSNLGWLSDHAKKKVVLRVPVVPGFNHDEASMRLLFDKADFLGFKTVHLLPYHTLGMGKYEQLDLEYPWPHTKMLHDIDLLSWQQLGQGLGLHVQIGG